MVYSTEINGQEIEMRVFKNVEIHKEGDDTELIYMDSEKILDDEQLMRQVILRAKKELNDWINRWEKYSELQPIAEELKRRIEQL